MDNVTREMKLYVLDIVLGSDLPKTCNIDFSKFREKFGGLHGDACGVCKYINSGDELCVGNKGLKRARLLKKELTCDDHEWVTIYKGDPTYEATFCRKCKEKQDG